MSDNNGFSLIELFVILVLISIGAFIAFSGWNSPENRVRSAAFQIAADMRLARDQAVKMNQDVLLCQEGSFGYRTKTSTGTYLTELREIDEGADNSTRVQLTFSYTGGCVVFTPLGLSSNGNVTVSLGTLTRTIVTNRSGRIKVE